MNAEINKLIKKTKRRRRFLIFLFLLVVIISVLFLGDFEIETMGTVHNYGAGLPGLAVFLIVAAECALFFFIGVLDATRVEGILLTECDPEKYFAVRTSGNRYLTTPSDLLSVGATAAFAGGDFNTCMNYAVKLANDKKGQYRFASAVAVFKASFFLGNRENMAIAFERAKAEASASKQTQKTSRAVLDSLAMLAYLYDGNIQEALKIADNLAPADITNYTVAFNSFFRGLVYRAANEKNKAIHCFMTASEKGGKLFIKAESERYLTEYNDKPPQEVQNN